MCGRAVANHHGHFARIQVELLAVAHGVAGCQQGLGGSSRSGDSSHGEVEIEETDGGGSWQEEYDLVVPFHGRPRNGIGQKEFGQDNGIMNKKKRG